MIYLNIVDEIKRIILLSLIIIINTYITVLIVLNILKNIIYAKGYLIDKVISKFNNCKIFNSYKKSVKLTSKAVKSWKFIQNNFK